MIRQIAPQFFTLDIPATLGRGLRSAIYAELSRCPVELWDNFGFSTAQLNWTIWELRPTSRPCARNGEEIMTFKEQVKRANERAKEIASHDSKRSLGPLRPRMRAYHRRS
jgi:hypothetical protein